MVKNVQGAGGAHQDGKPGDVTKGGAAPKRGDLDAPPEPQRAAGVSKDTFERSPRNLGKSPHNAALNAVTIPTAREDWFLQNPPNQPKAEIAAYVEEALARLSDSQKLSIVRRVLGDRAPDALRGLNIFVPRRFPGFLRAVESGSDFICRSEHRLEYYEAAGLWDSIVVNASRRAAMNAVDLDAVNLADEALFETAGSLHYPIVDLLAATAAGRFDERVLAHKIQLDRCVTPGDYASMKGISEESLRAGCSLSFWEMVPGRNFTMVADSSVLGRYHLLNCDSRVGSFATIEDGRMVRIGPGRREFEPTAVVLKLIAFYEIVRNLAQFNPRHCPLIEFQRNDDGIGFLQYHRTRDVAPRNWSIRGFSEEGYQRAHWVRGVTPPEGWELDIGLFYPDDIHLLDQEDGSLDVRSGWAFSELMTRNDRRRVQLIDAADGFDHACLSLIDHGLRSRVFNPPVAAIMDLTALLGDAAERIFQAAGEEVVRTGAPARIRVHVVSDGTECHIKLLAAPGL